MTENEAARDIASAWTSIRATRSGYFLIANACRNGDLYHVCSFAAAFRKVHGPETPLIITVSTRSQAKVASLFDKDFSEILIEERFGKAPAHWAEFKRAMSLPDFGTDTPILVHPQFYPWNQFALDITRRAELTWMVIYRQIMLLPLEAQPSSPPRSEAARVKAADLCETSNVVAGQSVLLFPYAQSLSVISASHFAELAQSLTDAGLTVFTSVSGDEAPIAGTHPFHIPFDLLLDVAEISGWVVAVRSGICDILATARCRKTFIYPSFEAIVAWGINAMGFASDAREFIFDFAREPGGSLPSAVMAGNDISRLVSPPRRLTCFIGEGSEQWRVIQVDSATDQPRFALSADTILVIHGVRPEFPLDLARFGLRDDDDRHIYVTADDRAGAYFEEVPWHDAVQGTHRSASSVHSIVILSQTLDGCLPEFVRGRVVPLGQRGFEDVLRIGTIHGSAGHLFAARHRLPIAQDGLQLMSGWSDLEAWGIWTDSLETCFRVTTNEAIPEGSILQLEVVASLSDAFPLLHFEVFVNGRRVLDVERGLAVDQPLSIPLAAAAPAKTATIVFKFRQLRSPLDQGTGNDARLLGLGLRSICLKRPPDPPKRGAHAMAALPER